MEPDTYQERYRYASRVIFWQRLQSLVITASVCTVIVTPLHALVISVSSPEVLVGIYAVWALLAAFIYGALWAQGNKRNVAAVAERRNVALRYPRLDIAQTKLRTFKWRILVWNPLTWPIGLLLSFSKGIIWLRIHYVFRTWR